MISIRAESRGDIADIHAVNKQVFETDAEAKLVDLLRSRDKLVISLVAEDQGTLIGHIAFSRVHNEFEPRYARTWPWTNGSDSGEAEMWHWITTGSSRNWTRKIPGL